MGLGFQRLALAHSLALAGVLHRQKQRVPPGIEAGPAQLTLHWPDRKAEGLAGLRAGAGQQPAAVVAEHIPAGAIGHQPQVAGRVKGQVVWVAEAQTPLPRRAPQGHHAPAESGPPAGIAIAESHHPAVGPEGLALGTGEDRRIAAAAVIAARRREGDQQVTIDRIDIGVFGPGAAAGARRVGSQVGIDQNRPLLA